jgi:hypothetical protein
MPQCNRMLKYNINAMYQRRESEEIGRYNWWMLGILLFI